MILKLKRTPGLYIVGFMGSGKSTVGRALAKHLGWRFVDLDEDIEAREQILIAQFFDERGEEEFRRVEHEALKRRVSDIARGVPWVLAVGGGCFAQPKNLELLTNHGIPADEIIVATSDEKGLEAVVSARTVALP